MKKLSLIITLLLLVLAFTNCSFKRNLRKCGNSDECWKYVEDIQMFKENKNHKFVFDSTKAKVFFVAKWNTFIPYRGSWDGYDRDGGVISGYEKGKYVYFLEKYKVQSEQFFKETGKSFIVMEKRFYKTSLSEDPRRTCFWISLVMKPYSQNIDTFLRQATCIEENPSFQSLFPNYINDLKRRVLASEGVTDWEKIINFTAQTVPGKPETWNAWRWPGYN